MSAYARRWGSLIRGLNPSQHGYVNKLCDYHRHPSDDPWNGHAFLGRERAAEELGCSKIYITQIAQHVEHLGFLARAARKGEGGIQTSNESVLNFRRFFPITGRYDGHIMFDTGHGKEKRRRWVVDVPVQKREDKIKGYFRRAADSAEAAQEILAVWLQPVRHRRQWKTPPKATLWIAVASAKSEREVLHSIVSVAPQIRKDFEIDFDCRLLNTEIRLSSQ